MLKEYPIRLSDANAYVENNHRTHKPVHRDMYRIGCADDGRLCGVIQVGRPVSRMLDDGKTLEVVRCCTDGTMNACTFLYSRATRIAKLLGYSKIITYILEDECGGSLLACGWEKEADVRGHSWDCPSRPRETEAPECNKQRWSRIL